MKVTEDNESRIRNLYGIDYYDNMLEQHIAIRDLVIESYKDDTFSLESDEWQSVVAFSEARDDFKEYAGTVEEWEDFEKSATRAMAVYDRLSNIVTWKFGAGFFPALSEAVSSHTVGEFFEVAFAQLQQGLLLANKYSRNINPPYDESNEVIPHNKVRNATIWYAWPHPPHSEHLYLTKPNSAGRSIGFNIVKKNGNYSLMFVANPPSEVEHVSVVVWKPNDVNDFKRVDSTPVTNLIVKRESCAQGAELIELPISKSIIDLEHSDFVIDFKFHGKPGLFEDLATPMTFKPVIVLNDDPDFNKAHIVVTKSGSGNGMVVTDDSKIICGDVCHGEYTKGDTLTLRAVGKNGSTFGGWDAQSGCPNSSTCEMTLTDDVSVTAYFSPSQEEASNSLLHINVDGISVDEQSFFSIEKGQTSSISYSASDNDTLRSLTLSINSVTHHQSTIPFEQFTINDHFSWTTANVQPGIYTFELKVVDQLGITSTKTFEIELIEQSANTSVQPDVSSNLTNGFSLNSGETRTVSFVVSNEGSGDTISGAGEFVVSISDGVDIVSVTSSDPAMSLHQYEPGDFLFDKAGNSVSLQHEVLQTQATYAAGVEKTIDVTFRANTSAQHLIHYRATFAYDNVSGLEWANSPSTGNILAPQNWPVNTITLNTGGTGPAHLQVQPSQLNYGAVIKNTAKEATLYISNNGAETLSWQIVDHPQWIIPKQTSGNISGGGTSTINVVGDTSYTSVDPTPHTGTIEIESNGGHISLPVEILETEADVHPPIYPVQDSYMLSSSPDQNYGNSAYLEAGEKNGAGAISLLQFDLSSLPANKKIESAKLYVYAYDTDLTGDNRFKLYNIRTAYNFTTGQMYPGEWSENSMTWNNHPGFSSEREILQLSGNGKASLDVTLLTQLWYHDWADNNGIALFPYDGANGIWAKFYSSEASDISKRPYLEITYSDVTPDFSLVVTPNPAKVGLPGDAIEYTLTAESVGGFSGEVALSLIGNLPPNLSASPQFATNTLAMGESTTLTIQTSATTPEGNYRFALQGISGGKTKIRDLNLQVGRDLGPALVIHEITAAEEPSAIIRVNYTANDSSQHDMTTQQWQYSLDSTDGVQGTWYDIDPAAIGYNSAAPSGQESSISWDTTAGANNLVGISTNNLWFRMKVDTGVPVMTQEERFSFSGGVDFEGLYFDTANNILWSTEDGSEADAQIHKHDPGNSFEIINSFTFWGDTIDETQSDEPYGITWLPDSGELLVAERVGYSGSSKKDEGLLFHFDLRYPDSTPPYFKDYDYWFDPSEYRPNEFTGLTWAKDTVWSTIDQPDPYILKHVNNNGDFSVIAAAYEAPGNGINGITWDGTTLWTAGYSSGGKIYRHNMDSSLSVAETYTMPYTPTGLAWDGTFLYSCTEGSIYKYSVSKPVSEYVAYGPLQVDNNLASTISGIPVLSAEEDPPLFDSVDLWSFTNDIDTPSAELLFSITGVSDPGTGAYIRDNRYLELEPAANWHGTAEIYLQVQDTDGDTANYVVSVNISSVNDAPQLASIPDLIFDENGDYYLDVSRYVTDPDDELGDLAFTLSNNSNISGVFDPLTNKMVLTATTGWTGSEDITLTVTDPGLLADSKQVHITVYPLASPHIIADIWQPTVAEGGTKHIPVLLSAQPAGNVQVTASMAAECTAIHITGGADITFTPTDWDQQQTIELTSPEDQNTVNDYCQIRLVADGLPDLSIPLFSEDNDPALHLNPSGTLAFGATSVGGTSSEQTVVIQNTGGGMLTGTVSVTGDFVITSGQTAFSLAKGEVSVLHLTFAPVAEGPATSTLTVVSDIGSAEVYLTGNGIMPVAPEIIGRADETIPAHQEYRSSAPVLQAGYPSPTWTLVSGPQEMTIDPATGIVSWTNPVANGSPHLIEIHATNPTGADSQSWQLNVTSQPITVEGTLYLPPDKQPFTVDKTLWVHIPKSRDNLGDFEDSLFCGGFTLAANTSSVSYSCSIADNSGYFAVEVWADGLQGITPHKYYNQSGDAITLQDADLLPTDQNYSDLDIHLFGTRSISGTVTLPNENLAPEGGIGITVSAGASPYAQDGWVNVVIPEGTSSVAYTVEVPMAKTPWFVYYGLWRPGLYVERGYYGANATTKWDANLAVSLAGDADHSPIDLTILAGHLVSGSISLPDDELAGTDMKLGAIAMSVSSTCQSQFINNHWGLTIDQGTNSTDYQMLIPDDVGDYVVGYELEQNYPGYVLRNYYNVAGEIVRTCDATKLDSSTDQPGINVTVKKGHTLSGTVTLPTGYTPSGDLNFGIVAYRLEEMSHGGWTRYFITDHWVNMALGTTSIPYEFTVPEETGDYIVSYYFSDPPSDLMKEAFYSTSGMMAAADQATQLPASQDNPAIHLVFQEVSTNSLSGTISLPAGYTLTEDVRMAVVVKRIMTTEYGWYTEFLTDHWLNFPMDQTSIPYELFVPNNAGNYIVSYYISDPPQGLRMDAYYAENGMESSPAEATELSSAIPQNSIDIVLQETGGTVSGTIKLPGDLRAEQDIIVKVSAMNSETYMGLGSAQFTIPQGENGIPFEYTLPYQSISYLLTYELLEPVPGGYRTYSYYSSAGPANSTNCDTLDANSDYPGIVLELWPSISVTGTIFLPEGVPSPASLFTAVTFYETDGATPSETHYVRIPEGVSEIQYSAFVEKDSGQIVVRYEHGPWGDDLSPNGFQASGYYKSATTSVPMRSQATRLATSADLTDVHLYISPLPMAGDYNLDGEVGLQDVFIALKVVAGEPVELNPQAHIDATGDGIINMADVTFLLNQIQAQ